MYSVFGMIFAMLRSYWQLHSNFGRFFGDVYHQLEIPSKGGAQCPVAAMQAARLTSQKQVFENIKIINNCVVSVGFSPGNDSQLPF